MWVLLDYSSFLFLLLVCRSILKMTIYGYSILHYLAAEFSVQYSNHILKTTSEFTLTATQKIGITLLKKQHHFDSGHLNFMLSICMVMLQILTRDSDSSHCVKTGEISIVSMVTNVTLQILHQDINLHNGPIVCVLFTFGILSKFSLILKITRAVMFHKQVTYACCNVHVKILMVKLPSSTICTALVFLDIICMIIYFFYVILFMI